MSPIFTHNGKILQKDGKLSNNINCCCSLDCPSCQSCCCPCPRWVDVWKHIFNEDQEAWDEYLAKHNIPAGTTAESLDQKFRAVNAPGGTPNGSENPDGVGYCGCGGAPGYTSGEVARWDLYPESTQDSILLSVGWLEFDGTLGDAIADEMLRAGINEGGAMLVRAVPYESEQQCNECASPMGSNATHPRCAAEWGTTTNGYVAGGSDWWGQVAYQKTYNAWPGAQREGDYGPYSTITQSNGCQFERCWVVNVEIQKRENCVNESVGYRFTAWYLRFRICPCSGVHFVDGIRQASGDPNGEPVDIKVTGNGYINTNSFPPLDRLFYCDNLDNTWIDLETGEKVTRPNNSYPDPRYVAAPKPASREPECLGVTCCPDCDGVCKRCGAWPTQPPGTAGRFGSPLVCWPPVWITINGKTYSTENHHQGETYVDTPNVRHALPNTEWAYGNDGETSGYVYTNGWVPMPYPGDTRVPNGTEPFYHSQGYGGDAVVCMDHMTSEIYNWWDAGYWGAGDKWRCGHAHGCYAEKRDNFPGLLYCTGPEPPTVEDFADCKWRWFNTSLKTIRVEWDNYYGYQGNHGGVCPMLTLTVMEAVFRRRNGYFASYWYPVQATSPGEQHKVYYWRTTTYRYQFATCDENGLPAGDASLCGKTEVIRSDLNRFPEQHDAIELDLPAGVYNSESSYPPQWGYNIFCGGDGTIGVTRNPAP